MATILTIRLHIASFQRSKTMPISIVENLIRSGIIKRKSEKLKDYMSQANILYQNDYELIEKNYKK